MSGPSILLDAVTVVLDDGTRPLERVSMYVAPGEHVGIVGRAGTGKSSVLAAILGLTPPESGRIAVDGRELDAMSYREMQQHRRRSGLVFERRGLITTATIAENIALPLRYHEARSLDEGMIRERVRLLLNELGIEESADLLPVHASASVRKRAQYARALALEPTLLLVDAAQDDLVEGEQALCARAVERRRSQRGLTVVQTDHDGAFGPLAPGRIFHMEGGRMLDGTSTAEAA
jgi:D-methionine transport system ATP-binding protein